MNAAAKALAQGTFVSASQSTATLSSQMLGVILLIVAVLTSAFSVVYVKALDRNLFSQLQVVQEQHDDLNVKWGQLLLEENTWAAPARVQAIAQQQLGMVVPTSKEVAVIAVAQRNDGTSTNG